MSTSTRQPTEWELTQTDMRQQAELINDAHHRLKECLNTIANMIAEKNGEPTLPSEILPMFLQANNAIFDIKHAADALDHIANEKMNE